MLQVQFMLPQISHYLVKEYYFLIVGQRFKVTEGTGSGKIQGLMGNLLYSFQETTPAQPAFVNEKVKQSIQNTTNDTYLD